jgi:hypothetical protein
LVGLHWQAGYTLEAAQNVQHGQRFYLSFAAWHVPSDDETAGMRQHDTDIFKLCLYGLTGKGG